MKFEIIPWLEPLIDHLWLFKRDFLRIANLKNVKYIDFDCPDYGGLSENVIDEFIEDQEMADECAELLRQELYDIYCFSKTKYSFAKQICYLLTRGIVTIPRRNNNKLLPNN